MLDISKITILSARESLKRGEYSSQDLVNACLSNIKARDGNILKKGEGINAFIEVFDDALEEAKERDVRIKKGEDLPLLGIPIALKDNMLVRGKRVTAGSKILEGFVAPEDATAVRKLRDAGAVFIGRTNMDEFAMGSSTENSAYGVTRNPYDATRVSGGSSGGSSAALGANFALGAFGSDTGGSIREPAAFCGLVGLKPTYGRVSRSGLIALASSLDQIGPFAKSVEDAHILYDVVSGIDPMDSTTIDSNTYKETSDFKKVIGVPREFVEGEGIDESVKKNFEESIAKFKSLGYEVRDVNLPHLKYALSAYYIILPAEASSNLARFDGVKYGAKHSGKNSVDDYFKTRGEGFGKEVRRRIILGTYVLSSGYYDAYYGRALEVKSIIQNELKEAFKEVDLVLTPTTPWPAFAIGEKAKDPLSMYLADIFTVPANISGCPAVSLPSGFTGNLPLGIQLMADLGREDNLFVAGKDFLNEVK